MFDDEDRQRPKKRGGQVIEESRLGGGKGAEDKRWCLMMIAQEAGEKMSECAGMVCKR